MKASVMDPSVFLLRTTLRALLSRVEVCTHVVCSTQTRKVKFVQEMKDAILTLIIAS